jgi:hypothetical protein
VVVDIPSHYASDEAVLESLMNHLDDADKLWAIYLDDGHSLPVKTIRLGDVEIEPEE